MLKEASLLFELRSAYAELASRRGLEKSLIFDIIGLYDKEKRTIIRTQRLTGSG